MIHPESIKILFGMYALESNPYRSLTAQLQHKLFNCVLTMAILPYLLEEWSVMLSTL